MGVAKRRFCIVAPDDMFQQIERRGHVHQRSRNQEIGYLLEFAITELGGNDPLVSLPAGDESRTNIYLPTHLLDVIRVQANLNHRSMGTQMLMLLKFAMEQMTRRDLDVIAQLVNAGRAAPELQQTGTDASPPSS
jgi:hypothetical protein